MTKKKYRKEIVLKGYYISGDNECWCLAKKVDKWGLALGEDLIYPHSLIPEEIEDSNKKFNFKITIEVEEA